MIVEFPLPTCDDTATSERIVAMTAARDRFIEVCGGLPSRSRFVALEGRATIDGVGFFDVKHGTAQRGLSLLYLAVRALLAALVRSRRGLHLKDVELLVLRHKLEILRRQVARPKLGTADRALLARRGLALPRFARRAARDSTTLLCWHQAFVRRTWRQAPGRRRRSKPSADVREFV